MTSTIKIFSTLLANSILLSSLALAISQPDEGISTEDMTDPYDMTYKFLEKMEQMPVNEILSTASQDSFDGDIDYLIALLAQEEEPGDATERSIAYGKHQPTDTASYDMEEDGVVAPLAQPQAIHGCLPDIDYSSAISAMAPSTWQRFPELQTTDKTPTWEEGIAHFAGTKPQRPAAFGHYARNKRTESETGFIADLMRFADYDEKLKAADPTAQNIECSDAEMDLLMQDAK